MDGVRVGHLAAFVRDYMRAARRSFRCDRQDIVPCGEVRFRRDIVPVRLLVRGDRAREPICQS
jgi:hypothetical protein